MLASVTALLMVWLVPAAAQTAGEVVIFAHDLKPSDDLLDRPLVVYGRFRTRIQRTELRLHHCSIPFLLRRPDLYPRGADWLYVQGRLTRRNGKVVFDAESVREAPAPVELLRVRLQASDDRQELARLIDEAKQLDSLYPDERLSEFVREAQAKIRQLAFAQIKRGDYGALLAYIEKYGDQLSADERLVLRHRAFVWMVRELERSPQVAPDQWKSLAEKIAAAFPEAKRPRRVNPELAKGYSQDPDGYYAANPRLRRDLERLLLVRAYRHYFNARAEQVAPARYLALAEEARRVLPDAPEIAQSLYRQWVDYRRKDLEHLRRPELRELIDVVRRHLRDPGLAKKLYREWLTAREAELAPDDAVGRLSLARDYEKLLQDRGQAARLLLEAVQLEPSLAEARQRLLEMGYRLRGGQWFEPNGRPVTPAKGRSEAPGTRTRGVPRAGDLPSDVRRLMGGEPTRVARLATASGILEQWVYETERTTVIVEFRTFEGRQTVQNVRVLD